MKHSAIIYTATIGLSVLASGSEAPQKESPEPFRVEANLTLVRFHVVRDNRYVSDVSPSEVVVLEDGKEQQIALFESPGTPRRSIVTHLTIAQCNGPVRRFEN